jgi:hypothetical protein
LKNALLFSVLLICVLVSSRTVEAATIAVAKGGDLQAALNAAKPGDVITLPAGATFTGNFYLPAKAGSTTYITVRSAAADTSLPASGGRITPAFASYLPKIVGAGTGAAIRTAAGAHYWRLQFLEIVANASGSGDIVQLGRSSETVAAKQSAHFILDRVYIHGRKDKGAKRGVALNTGTALIRGSWIDEIKSTTQDSQAICGWNGAGPFVIENNYLSAAAENVMFGGADPAIPNLVPSDIRIVRNTFTKDLAWRGTTWIVKNLFEVKNGRRIVLEGNHFTYSWQASDQKGYAIVLTPANNGKAPWTTVEDITIRNNRFEHLGGGVTMAGYDKTNGSKVMARVLIQNNLFTDVSKARWGGGGGFVVAGGGAADITVDHNTVDHDGFVAYASGTALQRFTYTNNLHRHNVDGIYAWGLGAGMVSINKNYPGAEIRRNVFFGGSASKYPAENFFATAAEFLNHFVSASTGNWRLATSSPYRAAGTDGKDVGANIAAIDAARK